MPPTPLKPTAKPKNVLVLCHGNVMRSPLAGAVLSAILGPDRQIQLGGGTPIRVEAQDLVNGGIDQAAFGYYAVNVHDAGGLVLVDDGVV